MYEEFEKRDTVVIAVAQEDKDLKTHGNILSKFKSKPPFDIVADVNREKTGRYGRAATYLIDKKGVVREIFPALIHMRPRWQAVLNRMDELFSASSS